MPVARSPSFRSIPATPGQGSCTWTAHADSPSDPYRGQTGAHRSSLASRPRQVELPPRLAALHRLATRTTQALRDGPRPLPAAAGVPVPVNPRPQAQNLQSSSHRCQSGESSLAFHCQKQRHAEKRRERPKNIRAVLIRESRHILCKLTNLNNNMCYQLCLAYSCALAHP